MKVRYIALALLVYAAYLLIQAEEHFEHLVVSTMQELDH